MGNPASCCQGHRRGVDDGGDADGVVAGVFTGPRVDEVRLVVVDTEFTAGQRRTAEAHQLEGLLVGGRLGHPAHPQSRRPGLVTLLCQHVAKPVIDRVHRHHARGRDGVGDHGCGRVTETGANVGFQGGREFVGPHKPRRRERHAECLRCIQVFAGEHARQVEAGVFEFVGERVAEPLPILGSRTLGL